MNQEKVEGLNGYRIDDLLRVATLMEKCDVKPEDLKRLSDNICILYGAIMRGIRKEVKIAADHIIMECRYPGMAEVLRMIEEDKNGKG